MNSITEWMITEGIAQHGIQAGHIADGLKLAGLPREEQEARARLYRKWRSKSEKDKKKLIPSWQAYQLAIAGIDPADVQERQWKLIEEREFNPPTVNTDEYKGYTEVV